MSAVTQNYARWLRTARRYAATADDAADLLQHALLAAFEAQRQPLIDPAQAAWFQGVLRRSAAFLARGDGRRRARERAGADAAVDASALASSLETPSPSQSEEASPDDVRAAVRAAMLKLPRAQRSVLLLVLHGLDRAEIRQVLGLADTALRQRLAGLKKRLADASMAGLVAPFQAWLVARNPAGGGHQRAALARGPARIAGFRMGVSDPDGHLLGIHVPRRSGQ